MEKLSISINDGVHQGTWVPIHISDNGPQLSHLLFVDDVFLFTTAKNSQLRFITDRFARFSGASGLKFNLSKSRAFYSTGSGSSSLWFTPWTTLGRLGSLVPYVDIHDLHLSEKDMFSKGNPHTQSLYTQLPSLVSDVINNTNFKFNDSIEDTFIWTNKKNGTYTAKSGYNWLLSLRDPGTIHNPLNAWSWIWKLQLFEKIKFFFWLACHNSVPTLYLLNHRKMSSSATCTRCGLQNESFLHCIRDCATSSQALIFSAGVWWSWRHRNLMCLNNETCSPIRSGFGGIIRNTFGNYLVGFSGFIPGLSDILLVELYAIYKGLLLAKDMNIDELACYSDSSHCVNLIKGPQVRYHIHAVLIQDIKELVSQSNVSHHHTLRVGNQCVDFFAKLEASLDADFLTHASPP
ncbi:hypothetical protein TSUD_295290 [Trifolium subterraneum]|uniref:RNase H type-1 domain-containing protein n=1 Tax=Trifolium subterraneum TaxID=3900 RepID=A0A2Z6N0N4_TRISU|nr:hypothetical protein TSUD_295290 [Trifolium subterraneum]